jgi:hypothetical protein
MLLPSASLDYFFGVPPSFETSRLTLGADILPGTQRVILGEVSITYVTKILLRNTIVVLYDVKKTLVNTSEFVVTVVVYGGTWY